MTSREPDAATDAPVAPTAPAAPSTAADTAAASARPEGDTAATAARPAALLVVRLTRDDVGARVTVRHRLPADDAASLSDVVGVLLAWGDDDVLHVERRDGTVALLPLADVVAAKVVPPAPPSRSAMKVP